MRPIMDDKGDAVMVSAVLLLSIAVSFGGSMLLNYAEISGKESDMEHASGVEDSLLRLRTSMTMLLDRKDTKTTIVNRLTLGTYGNPYMTVARSSGEMSMTSSPEMFQMSVVLRSGGSETTLNTVNGGISYHVNNFYFHDQSYFFLGGGLIREEYGQRVMSSAPPIFTVRAESTWGLELRTFGMTGDPWSVSGIDTVLMSVSLVSDSDIYRDLSVGETIAIYVNGYGEDAWADYFGAYFKENGFSENVDYRVTEAVDLSSPTEHLTVEVLSADFFQGNLGEMEVNI